MLQYDARSTEGLHFIAEGLRLKHLLRVVVLLDLGHLQAQLLFRSTFRAETDLGLLVRNHGCCRCLHVFRVSFLYYFHRVLPRQCFSFLLVLVVPVSVEARAHYLQIVLDEGREATWLRVEQEAAKLTLATRYHVTNLHLTREWLQCVP